jgi:ABC-type polysaccharide/polyol phosphate transport system ATPase subunit
LPTALGRAPIPGGYWALRGVDLAVAAGESVGIIGPNGAGKSTTLKLIARTIAPTHGRVRTVGRVASLIELGVGFHPDLTGADNVRFSAAILGMSRQAVLRHYDEIVAFAGIEEFMGTPVKRYSSGMLARLGFAVAAHLDAEIILVDEVLSVGDAAFQRRGFERMRTLQKQGATLLFVTHNLLLVPEICQRAVRLDKGEVVDEGEPKGVVDRFVAHSAGYRSSDPTAGSAAVIDSASIAAPAIRPHEPLGVGLRITVTTPHPDSRATIVITTLAGNHVAGTDIPGTAEALADVGTFEVQGCLDHVSLAPDTYRVLFTLVQEVHGVPLTLDQAGTTVAVIGDESAQYGPAHLSGSFQVRRADHGRPAS